jgi:hypothetical protein
LEQILLIGGEPWWQPLLSLAGKGLGGAAVSFAGGRATVWALNRLGLSQGLHAPFVATSVLVIFALSETIDASGFLAVYVAGLVVGNRPTRAHNTIVVFFDAATWLAQIVMFVLLGLLAWPERLPQHIVPGLIVALGLMLVARPAAVFACLAPFRFSLREKLFISWVGLRGAVGIFLAAIPLLVGLPNALLYFDVGFVVVLVSLAAQGWTIAPAARRLHIALPHHDPPPRRVELDLPGQLAQEPSATASDATTLPAPPSMPSGETNAGRAQRAGAEQRSRRDPGRRSLFWRRPGRRRSNRFFAIRRRRSRPIRGCWAISSSRGATWHAQKSMGSRSRPMKMTRRSPTISLKSGPRPPGAICCRSDRSRSSHTVSDGRVTNVGLRLAEPDPGAEIRIALASRTRRGTRAVRRSGGARNSYCCDRRARTPIMSDNITAIEGDFDYIIVGAGSAAALPTGSQPDPARALLLGLAGGQIGSGSHPGRLSVRDRPRLTGCSTEPEGLNGRSPPIARQGGRRFVGDVDLMRGQAADYDHWRQLGLTGWGWSDVLPIFKQHEHHFGRVRITRSAANGASKRRA